MSDSIILHPSLLRLNNPGRLVTEFGFVTVAALLPAFVHSMGWNGAVLLPMHWTVLLAGLVFGPLGGFVAGLISPLVSYSLSGLPALPLLVPMTIETASYGLTAGLFRKLKLNVYLSTLLAMVVGRLAYTLVFLSLGRISGSMVMFWQKAFMPGLVSAIIMLMGLPLLASGISYLLKDKE